MEGSGGGARIPPEVAVLERWWRAGVDCAVGELRGRLYGFAFLPGVHSGWSRSPVGGREALAPERLGGWVVLEFGAVGLFWSQEVRARFTAPAGELSGWEQWGWAWAVRHGYEEVNAFVDAQYRWEG